MTSQAGTETGGNVTRMRRRGPGRLDGTKQEAVLNRKPLIDNLQNMQDLLKRIDTAQSDYSDAVKATAEACGCKSSVINTYVRATAGEKLANKKREVEQLAFLFDDSVQPKLT